MPTKPTGRPRGRPKGAKNIPTIETFVVESLDTQFHAPPPRPRGPAKGPWAGMTPEERSAYARKLAASRKTFKGGRPAGIPKALTQEQHAAILEAQKPIIARIMKKMADNGQLPDDPFAVEALKEAMTVLRSNVTPKDKLSAARLVLDFTKAKPTSKVEHTIRSAEDILDEMADDEPTE